MSKFYSFTVKDIAGEDYSFEQLKGKKVMIVNTASECGLTPQYESLQELYDAKGGDKFEIIGFPANDFGAQEPGSDESIATFCKKNYGVTFPMMSKIKVKNEDRHELYNWLLEETKKNGQEAEVKWNFHKFLVDENGDFVKSVDPLVLPIDETILSWIDGE